MNNCYQDVFRSFLVKNAEYSGIFEIPILKTSENVPNKIILFSQALTTNDYNCWIAFYEHDYKFERIWNRPRRYLPILKKFLGVISPDFSLYRNMPLAMQVWNTYRGRALANWWQENGIEVIPNIRFGDERTYDFCFAGIEKNSTIALGTHGCIKKSIDKKYFKKGLEITVESLSPRIILVYGSVPEDIFGFYKNNDRQIISYESIYSQTMQKLTYL